MSSYQYTSGPSWSWPREKESASRSRQETAVPGAFSEESYSTEPVGSVPSYNDTADVPPKAQRHYASRTCRICLEVVPPTFEPAPEDAESGRLIRPCKCKGTQRYVHEGCLQEWRYADPAFGRRNYFECPTCKFRYQLERMRWSRWISSTITQVILTILILFTTVFILGFVADPILNLYMDPLGTITTNPMARIDTTVLESEDEAVTWWEHTLKGLASLGLLGALKVIFASPWQWFQLRNAGLLGGGRPRNGRAANGRDRLESISWYLVAIGIFTFLWAVWKAVRAWSRRTLEKAGEKVVDVQGDDEDFEEVSATETRETQ